MQVIDPKSETTERTDDVASGKTQRFFKFWNLESVPIVRRIVVAVIGGTVLLIGIALLVLPGPAFVVIPLGLVILASEFAWARHWLKKVRRLADKAKELGRNFTSKSRPGT